MRCVRDDAVLSGLLRLLLRLLRWLKWRTGETHGGRGRQRVIVSHEVLVVMGMKKHWSGGWVMRVVVYRRGGNERTLLK